MGKFPPKCRADLRYLFGWADPVVLSLPNDGRYPALELTTAQCASSTIISTDLEFVSASSCKLSA
jgi:hypothetical protein